MRAVAGRTRRSPARRSARLQSSHAASAPPPSSGTALRGLRGRGETEAPLARVEVRERGLQRGRIELGPQAVREIQLRIGKIPQKEIAEASLATRANEQ